MEKGLKEDYGFPEASIQVIVHGVQQFPITLRLKGLAVGELLDSGLKTVVEFLDEFREGVDFAQELRFPCEEDLAKQVIETGHALTSRILEIPGVEGNQIRSDTKMLGMFQHGPQERLKRMSEPLTKCRGNTQKLVGFCEPSISAHTKRLVEIHAEHCICGFQSANAG